MNFCDAQSSNQEPVRAVRDDKGLHSLSFHHTPIDQIAVFCQKLKVELKYGNKSGGIYFIYT